METIGLERPGGSEEPKLSDLYVGPPTLYCKYCKTEKPNSDFYRRRDGNGLNTKCKQCFRDYMKARRKAYNEGRPSSGENIVKDPEGKIVKFARLLPPKDGPLNYAHKALIEAFIITGDIKRSITVLSAKGMSFTSSFLRALLALPCSQQYLHDARTDIVRVTNITVQDVVRGLLREAHGEGPDTKSSDRIKAWELIAKMMGFTEKVTLTVKKMQSDKDEADKTKEVIHEYQSAFQRIAQRPGAIGGGHVEADGVGEPVRAFPAPPAPG